MSLRPFFEPSSIAIVGASPNTTKVGGVVAHTLIMNMEKGILKAKIYPINLKHEIIFNTKCYKSLKHVDAPIDLVIVAIPAPAVPEVLEEAGQVGVKACIIISSGFKEVGNVDLQNQVVNVAKKYGIRIIGPNCLGVFDPFTGVDSLFLPEFKQLSTGKEVLATPRPRPGSIVLISQSGALGAALLDYMAGINLGLRCFVSFGNRADVDESELLEYFMEDRLTKVILLYLESVSDGRRFLKAAKNTSLKKPIVALKVGKSKSGARGAASHTGSLAGIDQIYQAAFEECGVIRANTIEELFDMGRALLYQPPALGNNAVILTNAGGPGILAADALEDSGLQVVELSERTKQLFKQKVEEGVFPPIMSYANPVDLSAQVSSDGFREALNILLDDPKVNAILVITLHHTPFVMDDIVGKVAGPAFEKSKPVIAVDIGATEMAQEIRARFEKFRVPSFNAPERAARALYALAYYGMFLKENGVSK
ncbi:MAG: CoA-binding protein [Nitrososphaeria archaeon]